MTSYALAILLYLNALAATSYAQDPENDPDYRGNDPEGAVSTSKLQIHVSRSQYIYSLCNFDFCGQTVMTVIAATVGIG